MPVNSSSEEPLRSRLRWGRISRGVLLAGVIPYVGITALMTLFQRQMLYHPVSVPSLQAADLGMDGQGIEDVELTTGDGFTIRGWLLTRGAQQEASSRNLVLYFPGNASDRLGRLDDLSSIASCGFDVLIFDYRGYADSEGLPSETALTSDAKQIWEFATQQLQYSQDRIVIYGESLGGGVALSLWSGPGKHEPRALILKSTFTSMADTVSWHYPIFPFRWLLLDQWPSIERIASVPCETLIFHGTADAVVPFEHGQILADMNEHARLIEMPGGSHNAIPVQERRGTCGA